MPIEATCPTCGKKYSAPDRLAGKGMRCRSCGGLILLPGGGRTAEASANPAAAGVEPRLGVPSAPRPGPHTPKANTAANAASPAAPPPPRLHPLDFSGGGARAAERHSFGEPAISESDAEAGDAASPFAVDRAPWPEMPYQRELDIWGPRLAVTLSLLFAACWMSAVGESISGWIWLSRFALSLATFFLFVGPLTLITLHLRMRRALIPWPPHGTWLGLAAFLPAWAFAVSIWNAGGGSTPALVFGICLGLVLSAGATWFWFRLQPEEIPGVSGPASVGFVGGWLLSLAILWLINLLAEGSVGKMADPPSASPVGQAFAWNPAARADVTVVLPKTPAPRIVGTSGGDSPAAQTPAPEPADAGGSPLAGATSGMAGETTGQAQGHGGDASPGKLPVVQDEPGGRPLFTPADPARPRPDAPGPLMNGNEAVNGRAAPPAAEPLADKPYVKRRSLVPLGPGVEGVTAGLIPGPAIGVLRKTDSEHFAIEAWADGRKASSASLGKVQTRLAVHPDGSKWARVSLWPFGLDIAGFDSALADRAKLSALGKTETPPEALGFTGANTLLLQWEKGLAMLDYSEGLPGNLRTLQVPAVSGTRGTPVLAVDASGKLAAIAFTDRDTPTLAIIDLANGTELKRLKIDAPGTVSTGVAFSPDGKLVAVYQEGARGSQLVAYNVRSGARTTNVVYSAPPARKKPSWNGSSIAWLSDGKVLILYGDALLLAHSGKILDRLDLDDLYCQHILGDGGLEIVQRGVDEPSILRLTLDETALAAEAK